MTDYQIKWTETAIQSLEKIDGDIAKRIFEKVNRIGANPFRYVKRLKAVPLTLTVMPFQFSCGCIPV